jgi:hypothetical protein
MKDGKWLLRTLGVSAAVFCLAYVVFRFVFNEAVDDALRGATSGAIGGLLGGYWLRRQKSESTQG